MRPARIANTPWATVVAAIWSWVTSTAVIFGADWRFSMCGRVPTRSSASRFESGSSVEETVVSHATMMRPSATRWRPGSSAGRRSRKPTNSTVRMAVMIMSWWRSLGTRRRRRGKPTFSWTGKDG